jgi:hypothetical protein
MTQPKHATAKMVMIVTDVMVLRYVMGLNKQADVNINS